MAFLADDCAGIIYFHRHYIVHGVGPVMPVLTEGFRNQDYSRNNKTGKHYGE
jgi:hypothetical protein